METSELLKKVRKIEIKKTIKKIPDNAIAILRPMDELNSFFSI